MRNFTFEEVKARIHEFRPIDDTFFAVLANDKKVCEEILRVILEDPYLTVQEVHAQDSIRNLHGRSVQLDALCTLGSGAIVNIEIQRSDNDDHLKRARYHASCVTAGVTEPGVRFESVPDVIVVFISEFDLFRRGKTIYHVSKILEETGDIIDDGLTEIFVNTKVNDGSFIAELMNCFLQKEVDHPDFPHLSNRVKQLKESKGGVTAMDAVMERFARDYAKEYADEKETETIESALRRGNKPDLIADIMNVSLSRVLRIQEGLLTGQR